MNIYLARHGQTNLNKQKLMQGRIEEPLNDTGRNQALLAREQIKNVKFDAVISSPLSRAKETAAILADVPMETIETDERIIEVTFGKYERKRYYLLGFHMTLFWLLPELIPAPKTVEPISSMVERSRSFLTDLKKKDYENVLVVCHGGIIRALCGVIENRPHGIKWRPKPKNSEIRIYEI